MHPVCFKIGDFPVHWYGVMMAFGFLAALLSWTLLGRKEGRNFNFCSDLLFWIMISGILGARIAYVISNLKDFLSEPLTILRIDQGGLTYYGGFIGAGLAIYVFAKVRREKIWALLDFVITSVPLAHAFGRIGCFLNGCCYGTEHHGLFAVSYPAQSYPWHVQVCAGKIDRFAPRSLLMHPVQLYEAAINLFLYFLLIWAYRRRKQDSGITCLYLLAYPFARFWLEFLRGDERMCWMGLSVAQLMSIVLFVMGVGIWLSERSEDPPLASAKPPAKPGSARRRPAEPG